MAKRLQKLRDKIAAEGFVLVVVQMGVVADVMCEANTILGDEVTDERLRQTRRVTQVARHLRRIAVASERLNEPGSAEYAKIVKENMGHRGRPRCQHCGSKNVERDPDHGEHPSDGWQCVDCRVDVSC